MPSIEENVGASPGEVAVRQGAGGLDCQPDGVMRKSQTALGSPEHGDTWRPRVGGKGSECIFPRVEFKH